MERFWSIRERNELEWKEKWNENESDSEETVHRRLGRIEQKIRKINRNSQTVCRIFEGSKWRIIKLKFLSLKQSEGTWKLVRKFLNWGIKKLIHSCVLKEEWDHQADESWEHLVGRAIVKIERKSGHQYSRTQIGSEFANFSVTKHGAFGKRLESDSQYKRYWSKV